MKKLLNTLFVSTQGAYLAKEGQTVIVKIDREVKLRLPIHGLGGIVCFGSVSISPPLMHFCAERNVLISFVNEYGKFLARVLGPVSGNILLRKEQFRRSDNAEKSAGIAKNMVIGKLINARAVLSRFLRDHQPDNQAVLTVVDRLKENIVVIKEALSLEQIRGIEGESAKIYFSVFDNLILEQKKDFVFSGRNRRPPMDNINAMLSFVYTLLCHDIESALETVGLDPQSGFLHRDRPGRPGLALDLMEEFRHSFADRFVLSLVNLRKLSGKSFKKTATGAVVMSDDARKILLQAYQERKKEEIKHPYLEEKIPIGMLFFAQALILARFIRGDIDAYPPFIWR